MGSNQLDLGRFSAIIVSISGGKDSQVCLDLTYRLVRERNYGGRVLAIHADTGAEWKQSWPHCEMLCKAYGFELFKAMPNHPLPNKIEARCRKLQVEGRKGGWPSAACRYCTSDCKRGPIAKTVRNLFTKDSVVMIPGKGPRTLSFGDTFEVLMITGERRQESSHRAKLPEFSEDKELTIVQRKVLQWRPILDYKLEDVWQTIKTSGLPRHVAYDLGNERLSCGLCVLATEADLRNGAKHCPELAERFLRIERETGHTFRHKKSLAQILGRNEPELI
jgi:3'-phosphoadenosine 5'-phosphosulfate sulfotransferase (PAPS reductase)/FAD synthetase